MKAEKMTESVAPKTLGEQRVRTDFNVSGTDEVTIIKEDTAKLINFVNTLSLEDVMPGVPETSKNQEKRRLIAIALTSYEEAAMWAVKAATA